MSCEQAVRGMRFIDWDDATLCLPDNVPAEILKAVRRSLSPRLDKGWKIYSEGAPEHALQYLRVLQKLQIDRNEEILQGISDQDPNCNNKAFREAADTVDIENVQLDHYN